MALHPYGPTAANWKMTQGSKTCEKEGYGKEGKWRGREMKSEEIEVENVKRSETVRK